MGQRTQHSCQHFGLDLQVFMVKVSYDQKPYRKSVMNTYSAQVFASPSDQTEIGRRCVVKFPNIWHSWHGYFRSRRGGYKNPDTVTVWVAYSITLFCTKQLLVWKPKTIGNDRRLSDVVIGCFGGGSNFSGIAFPFCATTLRKAKRHVSLRQNPLRAQNSHAENLIMTLAIRKVLRH